MNYRNILFKNLLKYSFQSHYLFLFVLAFTALLLWFASELSRAKEFKRVTVNAIALRLEGIGIKLSQVKMNQNSTFNDSQFRSSIKHLLAESDDINRVIVKTENEEALYSLDDAGNLTVHFNQNETQLKDLKLFNDYTLLKLANNGNNLIALLVERVNPDLAVLIGAELKLALGNNIRVNQNASQWVGLSKPVSVSGYQEVLDNQLKPNIGRILVRTFIALVIITLIISALMLLQVMQQAAGLENELLLVEKSITENHEIENTKGEFISILKPMVYRIRFQLNELKSNQLEVNDRLNQFYRASVDAIVIHHDGAPIFFNPAFPEMTVYPESTLYRLRLFDIIKIDEDLLNEAREGRQPTVEGLLRQSNGNMLYVEVQVKSIKFRGQVAESVVVRDITHRKFMERELQLQRMRQVKSVIDGQKKERQRLSRELHDGLGQNLVAIKLKLESIPHDIDGELNATLAQVKQMFNHTIEEVRRISNNLMPAALKEFSLAVVLRNLCNEVESNSGISVGLTVGVLPEPIDQLLKTYVYRIVQEALTNVIKHSGASRANITVYADFSNLHLIIEDNGVGFNTSTPTDTGNGLYNMKERAILLNGSINIISSQGKGTKIVAQFPLKPQNQTVNG
ncbi:MAG: PAS domain-containing sensor histidine kinase [Bacteroidales bacterium]|nr:PAS domain-containing sensor histidine kinase [Bacteroidales bacterium]